MRKNKKIISIISLVLVTALFSSVAFANKASPVYGENYYEEIDKYIEYYEGLLNQYENEDNYEDYGNYNEYEYNNEDSNEIDQYIDYYDDILDEYMNNDNINSDYDYDYTDSFDTGTDYDYSTDYNYDYGTNNNSSQNDYYVDYGDSYDFPYYDYGSFYDDLIFGDYDYNFGNEQNKEEHVPGEDFLKTPSTIHYTFDLDSKYPKYIDTGVSASKDGLLQTDSLKEFLRQVSIQKESKFIEDIDKAMTVIDKKLIVLDANKTTGEMLEELFKDTSIRVKVQPTRAGGKFNLADYLEFNEEIPISMNGDKVDLIVEPIIDNQRVLFPIRSIGKALGATVEWDKEKSEAKIEKDEKIIIFKTDSDIVTVNGREYLISNKTHLDKEEERLLSVVGIMVVEFGATMEWDTEALVLNINIPQPEVDPDAEFNN